MLVSKSEFIAPPADVIIAEVPHAVSVPKIAGEMTMERHFTADQVAVMLNISRETARRSFLPEDDVMKISRPKSCYKRAYTTLRIPESVLRRVYRRTCGGGVG